MGGRALGFDIGTTTVKAALLAVTENDVLEIGSITAATPETVEALTAVAARLASTLTDRHGGVDAIGVASMAESGVALDANGQALTPILSWDGGHGRQDAADMASISADLFAATGVRLSGKTPLATWAWLRRTQSSTWRQMRHWLSVADLVVRDLTGVYVTDHTLAGRTGGYRLHRPGEHAPSFDADLLGLVGLTTDQLPQVLHPHQCAAAVTQDAARRYGVAAGVPVALAGHDHQVAAWAAGVRSPGEYANSLGTAEAVLAIVATRPPMAAVAQQGMSLTRTPWGDVEALVGGSAAAGATLQAWLATLTPQQQQSALAAATRDHAANPTPTGAAALPYLRGRQCPEPDPAAQPHWPPQHWPLGRRARAVVEGICYQGRWIATHQAEFGQTPARVRVIAGTRLPQIWLDLKAEAMPWPSNQVSAAEPVAAGAGLLALARADQVSWVPGWPRLPQRPTSPHNDLHRQAYNAFVERARRGGP
ncbi:MAG: FGGY-family carbohydrate kinase [Beutenbergiaceae bacterium]